MSSLCLKTCVEAPKTIFYFLTAKVRNWGIPLFFLEKWRYMVLHGINYCVGFMLINSI